MAQTIFGVMNVIFGLVLLLRDPMFDGVIPKVLVFIGLLATWFIWTKLVHPRNHRQSK